MIIVSHSLLFASIEEGGGYVLVSVPFLCLAVRLLGWIAQKLL